MGGSSPGMTPGSKVSSSPHSGRATPETERRPNERSATTGGRSSSPSEAALREILGWQVDAACRGADPALWYPEKGENLDAQQAKNVCKGCSVRIECLGMALVDPAGMHGIWAGFSERKLRRIRVAWRAGNRARVRAESPWALGALDELASRGVGWGG